ncbi:hypothetical protein A2483_04960 [Candidatus Peregrinibacteria bacterium RIFOXYC2_FULL_33_13]|nr:MAG: hypothetical protein UR27_C0002G0057 [Candidatus Peregrinibacteria bacterium GW2011_GWA2_33_10]KKP41072.1 MAG: hypothetical protein UR30_C0002G0106 [Candidatus Peregrinibacteria bacterium GW2011_GWC2_33_13]OGJ54262.1 MAG: hypothetical protein A2483_04960 [Candidatus Peregrinibacteria bacterium RIFOXYC2_FULL_33_13]
MKYEHVFKFMKNIVWSLILNGIFAIVLGLLILIFPDLLPILIGGFLIIFGIIALAFARRVNKYSKIDIEI